MTGISRSDANADSVRRPGAADEGAISAEARRRARRRRLVVAGARVLTLGLFLGGWQLLTTLKVLDTFIFGQPTGIVLRLVDWLQNGTAYGPLWLQVGITLEEALLGFAVGVAGGVVFGLLLGEIAFLSDVLGPYIKVLNAIPRIVLGSIFFMWLGLGTESKVALAAVLVFFVVFFNAFQGVREVDRNYIANARVLGARRPQIVRHVVLPSALSWIIASLHVAFGFAIIGAIVGEFLGSEKGLGLVIATAQNTFDSNGVYAAMLIIAAVALTAEALIGLLERRLLAWRPSSRIETQGI